MGPVARLLFGTVFSAFVLLAFDIGQAESHGPHPHDDKTITLVADVWCPFNCAPDSEKPGILIEIARKAFEPKGYKVVYKNTPWARAIEDTRQGKYSAIIAGSKADAPDFVFPDVPQGFAELSFFVNKGSPWVFKDMDSLKTISFGAVRDYAYNTEMDAYIAANARNMKAVQLLAGDNVLDINIKKLLKGRIGAFLDSAYVVEYVLSQNGLSDKIVVAGSLPNNDDQNLYLAFSPADPHSKEYAAYVSDTMAELVKSGEIEQILTRYGVRHNARQ